MKTIFLVGRNEVGESYLSVNGIFRSHAIGALESSCFLFLASTLDRNSYFVNMNERVGTLFLSPLQCLLELIVRWVQTPPLLQVPFEIITGHSLMGGSEFLECLLDVFLYST